MQWEGWVGPRSAFLPPPHTHTHAFHQPSEHLGGAAVLQASGHLASPPNLQALRKARQSLLGQGGLPACVGMQSVPAAVLGISTGRIVAGRAGGVCLRAAASQSRWAHLVLGWSLIGLLWRG